MPSPFPGMDPYLEGYLWPDVHSALASQMRRQLTPLLRPKYTARLEIYLTEDPFPEGEIGILYPDVEVLKASQKATQTSSGSTKVVTQPTLTLPLLQAAKVRLTSIEIRGTAHHHLISCIEVISPVNKREPGLVSYQQKRQRLYQGNVHLLEIDLIRRGTRPFNHPHLPQVPYCIALTRAQSKQIEIWAIDLSTPLPTVPVPLKAPDTDVPLDLQAALDQVYAEAPYDLSVDYSQEPPPPAFSAVERDWIQTILRSDLP
ncbi:MAG: DUF4058 family protein [Synechococcaceae cyanobacterium SM2_3_1]|nr:DUF4058 family protein [Synechococcaceae cyanobacterium SM2_3_1]